MGIKQFTFLCTFRISMELVVQKFFVTLESRLQNFITWSFLTTSFCDSNIPNSYWVSSTISWCLWNTLPRWYIWDSIEKLYRDKYSSTDCLLTVVGLSLLSWKIPSENKVLWTPLKDSAKQLMHVVSFPLSSDLPVVSWLNKWRWNPCSKYFTIISLYESLPSQWIIESAK